MHTAAELETGLIELEHRLRIVMAEMADFVAAAEREAAFVTDGFRTAKSWVKAVCNVSDEEAAARVRLAHVLRDVPPIGRAMRSGRIGIEQASVLAGLHNHRRCRPHLPDSAALLVEHAQQFGYTDFKRLMNEWRSHADPDGTRRSHDNARSDRRAGGAFAGTAFSFTADGDSLAGAEIMAVFRRFLEREFRHDWQVTKDSYGDAACPTLMPRTHAQRCFDAFHTMVRAAVGSGQVTMPEFQVQIVVDEDTFCHFSDAMLGQEPQPLDPASFARRRCHTVDGIAIDPYRVVAAAVTGNVRRIIVDSSGRVLDLGRRQRLFRGGAREAVVLAGIHCGHPGCDIPATACEIDHLIEWARGWGPTNPSNAGPRCAYHNRQKHRLKWTATRDRHGQPHTYRHDGSEIAPRRPRAPSRADADEPDEPD